MLILNPARAIIDICGGAHVVADMTRRGVYQIHRWTWPREKGGPDGVIPMDAMQMILDAAPARGIDGLTADQFIPSKDRPSRADLRILALMMDGKEAAAIARELKITQREVRSAEARLRASPEVAGEVWGRVDKRRNPKYRSRKARK